MTTAAIRPSRYPPPNPTSNTRSSGRKSSFANATSFKAMLRLFHNGEGIDLQFCHIVINYDLPWNPMKLEQRIGRIDRIGQESDKIFIYNITCIDTIEERVLSKLYDRINIFKSSIGDLEDIMGDVVERLALDLIDPTLSDDDRLGRAEQNILAVEQKRKLRNELEDKAIDLFGFRDYIIRTINDAKQLDRFVGPNDTMSLVEGFFASRYPGTRNQAPKNIASLLIRLSPDAKASFTSYVERVRPQVQSRLGSCESDILCVFDPKANIPKYQLNVEHVDAIHPLIRWIVEENERHLEDRQPCSAIVVRDPQLGMQPGLYTYFVHLWQAEGWKAKKEIHFFAAPVGGSPLPMNDSERLVVSSHRQGSKWTNWEEFIEIHGARTTLDALIEHGYRQYTSFETSFLVDNDQLCSKQEEYASRTADRKIAETEELIQRLEAEDKKKVIPMHRGRIAKIKEQSRSAEIAN